MKKSKNIGNTIWTLVLSIAALCWVYPVVMILLNSLKQESAISTASVFQLPSGESFAGLANYVDAITSKGFLRSLGFSLFITVSSVAAILVFCSMCAWYITRVQSKFSQILYYLCVLYGSSVPDGNVYVVTDGRQTEIEHTVEYLDHLFRIRGRTGGIYVLWFCKIHSGRGGRSSDDRRM